MSLNLDNFDGDFGRETPYILTSPTSLEACAQVGVQPKELIYRSIEYYEESFRDLPLSEVYKIYDENETRRQENLLKCQNMRNKIKSGRNKIPSPLPRVKIKDEKTKNVRYSSDTESNDGDRKERIASSRSVPDLRSKSNIDFQKPSWSPREYCPCQFRFDNKYIINEYLRRSSCTDLLASPELSEEDRKILECMVLKKGRALEWDRQSQTLRSFLETDKLRRSREEQLLTQKWADRLAEKRRIENIENSRRYLEVQGRWKESRENLQRQLENRDQRVEKYLEELNYQKRIHMVEKQKAEAVRQFQVGKTIQKLMEDDRAHRQMMREKLQRRLTEADMRKRRREQDQWRHIQEMNRLEDAKRCLKLERVEQNARQTIEELRNQIEEKEHRAKMNYLALQRVKSDNQSQSFGSRDKALEKAQLMHAQLLRGLDEWHKRVLELHMAAQDRAELKYLQEINRRKARVASERVLREERTLEMMRRVKENEDKRRELVLNVIETKENKVARLKADKERRIHISRVRAEHAAEMRNQLRQRLDPETFDRKAARVELELRVMRRPQANFSYKFVPRLFMRRCCYCRCKRS